MKPGTRHAHGKRTLTCLELQDGRWRLCWRSQSRRVRPLPKRRPKRVASNCSTDSSRRPAGVASRSNTTSRNTPPKVSEHCGARSIRGTATAADTRRTISSGGSWPFRPRAAITASSTGTGSDMPTSSTMPAEAASGSTGRPTTGYAWTSTARSPAARWACACWTPTVR